MGKTLITSVLLLILRTTTAGAEFSRPDDHTSNYHQVINNITDYLNAAVGGELRTLVGSALISESYVRNPQQWLGSSAPCPPAKRGTSCPPSKYRPLEGTCNNVRHPDWGARGTPFLRLIKPQYADGVATPRQSVDAHRLPSAADVVAVIQRSRSSQGRPHDHVTSLVGVWGEMLARDLAQTVNPESVQCCGYQHPECSIDVEGGTCREYMRSVPVSAEKTACTFDHREQMNVATSSLDGSGVYGATEAAALALRVFRGGLVSVEACAPCQERSGLGFLYATLLREHNRVAGLLARLNDHWEDDVLFQEAKRVVVAELQHVTYNEMLPIVLGEAMVEGTELKLRDQGYYTSYSSSNRAGTFNGVATAALRVFLSMIPESLVSNTSESASSLVHTLLSTPALEPSLRATTRLNPGWDTSALLIHMARDHGVAGYQQYANKCSNGAANFTELLGKMTDERVKLLNTVYRQVADVDLLAGGVLESPANGAVVGPTFACLLAEQFAKTRNSDRFWYENDIPPSSFNREQLTELRRVTLAGLLCANTPSLTEIQSQAFVREDPYLNVRIVCQLQPALDLSPWQQEETTRIPDELVMQAVEKAELDLKQRRKTEFQQWSKHGGVDPKSPMGTAAAFSKANKQALMIANTSILLEYASEELMNSLQSAGLRRRRRQAFGDFNRGNGLNFPSDLADDFLDVGLQDVDIRPFVSTPADLNECDSLEDKSPCDPQSPFRSISGHCNNLRNPTLGKIVTTFARLLQPAYENGISRPRLNSVTGVPLPSPRLVSTMVHADISNLHNRYSLMLMQFAQFLDHDITFTPVYRGFFASIPDCRSCDSPRTVHPECMPIPVPQGDHYYPTVNRTSGERMCLPFMRSLPGQQTLGPREQINQNSAFLDTSQVYGEHSCQARELRSFDGRLNVTRHPVKGKDLLPNSPNHPECKAPSGYCFIAGDGRASEQVALTVIHTLYMRQHNRLVDGLRALNPHWDDEKLYQHGRRILMAVQQHISYNEFLPRVLGWNAVNLYELKLRPQGYYKGYNPKCNPAIVNEFAAAAFRIGHSLLRPHIPRMSASYQAIDPPLLLRDGFFNPDKVYQAGIVDEITRGLVSTPMENLDQFITGEITNHLFEDRRIPHSGVDLIALNIQRSRDHALRPYNDYRALCNLKRATTFEDLQREIPPEVIARLKRIYATVDDIDLFPGGMSERPLQGGLVGPTFACIIGIQFRQLRKCDRFWYENDNPALRFTEAQLSEIRKMTLSKILCENMDVSSDIQRSSFDQPSNFLNPRVSCQSIPEINLAAWRETPQGCQISGRPVAIGESGFPTPCTSCICTAEGTQCASLRVTDCAQLLREFSREAILRDDVCAAQCGFLFNSDSSTSPGQSLADVTFTTTGPDSRARSLLPRDLIPPPPRLRPHQQSGGGRFRPPPLTRFVG